MTTFIGTPAADSIVGTDGDDTIIGNAGNDTLFGGAGNDSIDGGAGDDILVGGTGADTMIGGAGDDVFFVDNNADVVREAVGGGNDTVLASTSYTLTLGAEVETLGFRASPAPGAAIVTTPDTTTPTGGVSLTGNEFAQTIVGSAGNDVLVGGRNANPSLGDSLVGGDGDDILVIMNPNDTVVGGAGRDTAFVSVSDLQAQGQAIATYALAAGSGIDVLSAQNQQGTENLRLTGSTDTGETIVGNFGNNTLSGGGGGDTLIGLDGNDTYIIQNINDRIAQETGGFDTLTFGGLLGAATYDVGATLGANVSLERIELSNGVTSVTGNDVAQTIVGSTVGFVASTGVGTDETLNGGAGADTLIGNGGNDTFVVDVPEDVILGEVVGTTPTTDTVLFNGADRGYDLAAGVSVEVMAVAGVGTGVRLDSGTATRGVYLVGNAFQQTIYGAGGNDILNGDGAPAGLGDSLLGGAGNDIYRVFSQADVVNESQFNNLGVTNGVDAGGIDTIFTSANYSLATNATNAGGLDAIEILSAENQSSTVGLTLVGSAISNTIIGAMGNDIIDGGAGAPNRLVGLGGNDTYTIRNTGDVIIEAVGGGNDTANVLVTDYTLNAGAEVETINLNAATATNFVGNAFAQRVNGTVGNDTIAGGGGADTLAGGAGDDLYRVSTSSTVIIDNQGANVIEYTASTGGYQVANGVTVVAMSATGTGDVFLVGNSGVQTITGNAGNNILNGGGGVDVGGNGDTLVGGLGNDIYRVFNTNFNGTATAATTGDQVVEFAGQGNDTIFTSVSYVLPVNVENLIAADAVFQTNLTLIGNASDNQISGSAGNNVLYGGLGRDTLTGLGGADTFHFAETGANNADFIADFSSAQGDKISLDASVFTGFGAAVDGAEFQIGTVATGNQATILYDEATGRLFFDADGAGGADAVLFAQLNPGTALSAADFLLTPGGTIPTPQP